MVHDQPDHFAGFAPSNMTPVPDEFFDTWAPRLGAAEIRVLLYIFRRTFGFKKTSDDISLRQLVHGIHRKDGSRLDHGAGVAKSAAVRAIKHLESQGFILKHRNYSRQKGDEPTTYVLRFRLDPVSSHETRGRAPREHGGVLPQNPQETEEQVAARQETVPSKEISSNRAPSKRTSRHGADHLVDRSASVIRHPTGESIPGRRTEDRMLPARQAVSEVVALSSPPPEGIGPADGEDGHGPPPDYIDAVIADSSRELGDEKGTRSNQTRARRLWRASGLSVSAYTQRLYEAQAIVRDQANVQQSRGGAIRKRMAYFFVVLDDLLRPQKGSRRQPGGET